MEILCVLDIINSFYGTYKFEVLLNNYFCCYNKGERTKLMNEIERKFIVKEIPNLLMFLNSRIVQGYISFSPEIRIRNNGDKYYLTCKSSGEMIRRESETEIDEYTFDSLKTLVKEKLISKVRYRVPLKNGWVAELDIYQDFLEGLRTVEVEFPDLEMANSFVIPYWFGKEITSDARYKNKNLACLDEESLKNILGKEKVCSKKSY